jgi:endonuclease YncB( thermonuclease family)
MEGTGVPRPVCTTVVRVVVLSAAAALTVGCGGDGSAAAAGIATVERVVDGDTLVVRIGGDRERLRLLGIDAPEATDPEQPPECYGPEATARMAELLEPGAAIKLERDVEARDRFGRLLAYVFRRSDGLFVNLELVEEGFATTLVIEPNVAYRAEFGAAAASARDDSAGLWAACPVDAARG